MSDLHPNWENLIEMLAKLKYGKIEELSFESGIPMHCKKVVQSVRLSDEQ